MRYTRFEFRGQNRIDLRQVLRCLILVPAIGIIVGFILYRLLIVPNISVVNDKKVNEELFYESVMPKKFYIVQGGVFSIGKNAETSAGTIRASKIPAFVNQDEKYYRVILYTGGNYEAINKKTIEYKKLGLDYIVKETSIKTKEVSESYKSEKTYVVLSRIINGAGTAVEDILEETLKYEGRLIDYTVYSTNVKAICKRLDSTTELFNLIEVDNNNELADLKSDCQHIRATIESIIDNEGDLSGVEEKKFLSIQGYKNLVEHFNNKIN